MSQLKLKVLEQYNWLNDIKNHYFSSKNWVFDFWALAWAKKNERGPSEGFEKTYINKAKNRFGVLNKPLINNKYDYW